MYAYRKTQRAFTLLELMVTVAVVSISTTVAVPMYGEFVERSQISTVIVEIKYIEAAIERRLSDNGYPDSLADIFTEVPIDPWGAEFQYLRINGVGNNGKGKNRKDHSLVPINSDYDLYSMGPDGRSVPPLTAKHSRDDIVRANNGGFVGIATDY